MKRAIIFSLLLCLISCNWFSDKDVEKEKKREEYKKEKILNLNKNFEYQCLKSSLLHNIDKDTVAIIFKEILVNYSDIEFQENTKKIIGTDGKRVEISKFDFITQTTNKFKINQKSIILILNDVEQLYNIEDLEETVNYLNEVNDELEEELKKE